MALYAAQWMTSAGPGHLLNEDCLPKLFRTKRAANAWIKHHYGYIAKRNDLRGAPHYWRMPRVVEVLVFPCAHLKLAATNNAR